MDISYINKEMDNDVENKLEKAEKNTILIGKFNKENKIFNMNNAEYILM